MLIQSTLVISKTKELSEILRDIRTSTYQVFGVVGCGGGAVYLMPPGRPTDISLRLGKACYPCSRLGLGGECFSFFIFFFTFIPVPVSSLSLSFISTISFLPFSGSRHKMTHKG